MKNLAKIFAVALVFSTTHALAEQPANGFGLFGGVASHSMAATMVYGGQTLDSSSSGISIGIDYQIGLGDNFSINPFLMSSGEDTSGALQSGTTAGHGILGVQGRYWMQNEFFVGAHIGSYSEVLIPSAGGVSISANGTGAGLAAGWESKTTGLITSIQFDKATVSYVDADVDLTGFRLQVGYRWK